MTNTKQRIDWSLWIKAEAVLRYNTLCRGEEEELSQEEISKLNTDLATIDSMLQLHAPVISHAKNSFAKKRK